MGHAERFVVGQLTFAELLEQAVVRLVRLASKYVKGESDEI